MEIEKRSECILSSLNRVLLIRATNWGKESRATLAWLYRTTGRFSQATTHISVIRSQCTCETIKSFVLLYQYHRQIMYLTVRDGTLLAVTYSIRYCAWQKFMHGTLLAPMVPLILHLLVT